MTSPQRITCDDFLALSAALTKAISQGEAEAAEQGIEAPEALYDAIMAANDGYGLPGIAAPPHLTFEEATAIERGNVPAGWVLAD